MLYAFRTCGISVGRSFRSRRKVYINDIFLFHKGHMECIRSESCTDFLLLLFDIFGEEPSPDDLRGIVIDR